jgi:guanylate kinase
MARHLIVLSAPSGAGKTTVARHLLAQFPFLSFSVSATTRTQRPGEVHGKDYFFLSRDEFRARIEKGDLIEYEEIFGNYYGTLRSVAQEAINRGDFLIFDVDVKGALSLRNAFPSETLLIFVAPPDLETLANRLRSRQTETSDQIELRLSRAEMEMAHRDAFDVVLVNNQLEATLKQAVSIVASYTDGAPQQARLFDDDTST